MEATKPVRPEPMNVTTHHAKVRVSLSLSDPLFVAGDAITGKMEMECRADKGLGIGVMMVELFAIQELTSRDHHATCTFIHSRRVFQGPGYTPSNAVQPHPLPGDPQLPPGYYTARKGHSTFLFKLPVPKTSPNSISFGDGIATVRYEVRASVGVSWKDERRMLLEKKDVDVVESFDEEGFYREERVDPAGVVVAENGKIWVQAKLVGGLVVAGESACVELQVKNHSTKKNSSLQIGLSRQLVLPNLPSGESPPNALQITDTLLTVPFKGPEYVIPPGVEGVASLVFDVPKSARGVKGGVYLGDADVDKATGKRKQTHALFEVRCVLGVKMVMGIGSKDIVVDIPIPVVHPSSLPALPPPPEIPYYDYGYQPHDPHQHQYHQLQHQQQPHPQHRPQSPYENPYFVPPQSHTPHPHPHSHSQYAPPPPVPAMSPQPTMNMNMYYNLPMSPPPPMSPTAAPAPAPYTIDPSTGLVWLPPPVDAAYYGYPHDPQSYYHHYHHQQQQQPQPPPRPLSAGPGGGRESTRPLPIPTTLPGLPGTSVQDVRDVPSSPPTSAVDARGRKQSMSVYDLGLGLPSTVQAPTSTSRQASANYPGESAESGSGVRASRIANHLRVTSTAKGRGRSASPVGGMRYRHGLGGEGVEQEGQQQQEEQGGEERQAYAVATIHGNKSTSRGLGLHIPLPPQPMSASASLSPPLHSPRPVLSPKQSQTFTREGGVGGSLSVKMKSERVEELERMADEVVEKARDLSGDLPREEERVDVDINKTLPKPIRESPMRTPAKVMAKEADDYFGNAAMAVDAPPTPTKKFGAKSLGLGFGLGGLGRRESGLDALERKLLAEVGTRKVENEKRPDVWSVLGVSNANAKESSEIQTPKMEGRGAGGRAGGISPIAIPTPRQGPVDPLNDSAISSLTLPDCEVGAGTGGIGMGIGGGTGGGVGGGALEKELLELENAREREKQEEKERRRQKREKREKRRKGETGSEDSDNKTSVGGKSSVRTERKKREKRERTADGAGDAEGSELTEKKERRSGHLKRKGKNNARVAAWLGDMDMDVPTPPAEDVIAHTPSPGPAQDDTKREKSPLRPTPPSNPSRLPDPRSSGFVPIGTLKPDIYQRTLVPKDSPFASSNNIEEDARRITEIWSSQDNSDKKGSPSTPQVTHATNPWQSVRSPIFAKRANGLPVFPPLKEGADSEVKYDIRSARGGRGGKVTAVAAIWAAVADPSKAAEEPPSKTSTPKPKIDSSPPTPKPKPKASSPKSPAGLTSSRPKNMDLLSPRPTKPNANGSTTSSSSSRSGAAPRPNGIPKKFGVGVGVGAGASKASPAVLSSSRAHAIPTISSTASLAKPTSVGGAAGGVGVGVGGGGRKQSLPLPTKVPHTISDLPTKRLSMPATTISKPAGHGEAVNNLKAIAEGKPSDSPASAPAPKSPDTGLAFGQARLRELIKKYQGQGQGQGQAT
ncbi:hypothetical protein V5O48_016257 [Marasmius crinis-equi]|uniref:Arrestin-like N-terminal domain-containing protein n=1 Tax=Marasmius crinis-equi TaxID=585013 RepID=A0ABR3ESA3_9AGAR